MRYSVHITDRVDERIAGYAGRSYTSPPQPRSAAQALVAIVLGGAQVADREGPWQVPIAGGRRTVELVAHPGTPAQDGGRRAGRSEERGR